MAKFNAKEKERKPRLTREERLALPITPQQKKFAEVIQMTLDIEEPIPETKVAAKQWLKKYVPQFYEWQKEHNPLKEANTSGQE